MALAFVVPYLNEYLDYHDCLQLMVTSKQFYDLIHQYHSLSFYNSHPSIHALRHLPLLFPCLNSLHLHYNPPPSTLSPSLPRLQLFLDELQQFLIQLPIVNLSLTGYEIIDRHVGQIQLPPLSSDQSVSFHTITSSTIGGRERRLRRLTLVDIHCSSNVLYQCCHSSSLQELHVTSCSSLNDRILCKLFTVLPSLTTLSLQSCFELENVFYSAPLSLSPLRHLLIRKCSQLLSINSLHHLISCDVSHSHLSSNQLHQLIESNRGLRSLTAMSCPYLTSLSMTSYSLLLLNLQNNPNLKSLLVSCPLLQKLRVTNCYQLTQLDLYLNHLKTLDLTMLSSLDSFHLTSSALRSLNLTGCVALTHSINHLLATTRANEQEHLETRVRGINLQSDSPHTRNDQSMVLTPTHWDSNQSHSTSKHKSKQPRTYCCLCKNISSSCQVPPPWLLQHCAAETLVSSELDSNLDLILCSQRLFRPSYRCFQSVNFSLCCPSLRLSKINFPQPQEEDLSHLDTSADATGADSFKLKAGRRLTM
jgi:hypothetical protein